VAGSPPRWHARFIVPGASQIAKQRRRRHPDVEIKPIHHFGISSGVVDGASAILLTSKEYAEQHGLKPRARIVAMAEIGDSPTLTINAPVPAAARCWPRPF
jgi:acetyl-CoA C-acetyltransferase